MPLIGPEALNGLRSYMKDGTQDEDPSGFPDLMLRFRYVAGTRSPYNRKKSTFEAYGQEQACRIRPLTARELAQLGSNQLEVGTNMMHLPLDANLDSLDHIQQVARWGDRLTDPIFYDVVGEPTRNALEYTVQLKLVTNEDE